MSDSEMPMRGMGPSRLAGECVIGEKKYFATVTMFRESKEAHLRLLVWMRACCVMKRRGMWGGGAATSASCATRLHDRRRSQRDKLPRLRPQRRRQGSGQGRLT